ncbi:serine/threonine-protein kinase [Streptomyces palmae]|uniref:non-specific serine/threonine protein kinase n=1 Tax=Streptomyces palmae TaxID=1701085 RepID=A0A4Z0GQ20_9ACTN|nr:serine/threonine-protein kinase [Streptomyces palmae]TGA98829.1 serine/threonine protein kinase [Streptomyces palmae]
MSDEGRLIAGRYRLSKRIGSGGMGTVWLAEDELLGRRVAVKQLHISPHQSDDELATLHERTRREARSAARITHPNVVVVHDVVTHQGLPCIVMEYVPSTTLADVLKEGPITPAEASRIGRGMVAALRAAHAAGVLHRDVKPGNVLLGQGGDGENPGTGGGRVVLTDFGIAMASGTSTLTKTGEVVGSIDYIAPERVKGRKPGPASDLWALGATLYQAVEGRPPFRRTTAMETAYAIAMDPLEPIHRAGPLTGLIEALLAKEPEDRPSAEEVERALRAPASESETRTLRSPFTGSTQVLEPGTLPGDADAEVPPEGPEPLPGEPSDGAEPPVEESADGAEPPVEEPADSAPRGTFGPPPRGAAGSGSPSWGAVLNSDATPKVRYPPVPPQPEPAEPQTPQAPRPEAPAAAPGYPRSASGGHPQSVSGGHPHSTSGGHPQNVSGGYPQTAAAGHPQAPLDGYSQGVSNASPKGGARQGGGRARAVLVGVVALVVLAAGGAYVYQQRSDGGGKGNEGKEKPIDRPTKPGPTRQPYTAPPIPDGYQLVREEKFDIAFPVPKGWYRKNEEKRDEVNYIDPNGMGNIKINVMDFAATDQVTHFEEVEKQFQVDYPDSERLRLQATEFRGQKAAVWEFRFKGTAREWRAIDLGWGRPGGREYALYLSAPSSDWERYRPIFDQVRDGLRLPEDEDSGSGQG